MKKAAITPISLVLIVAVVLALIAVAYMWGMPMIEKRVSTTNYAAAESFVVKLDEAITDIVSAGGGEEKILIPFGSATVLPHDMEDPDNNSVVLQFTLPQPLAIERSVVYLGSVSFADIDEETGVYGRSSPGVMTLEMTKSGAEYLYKIKLHYRELETVTAPIKGYKLAVRSSKPSGHNNLIVSFGSTDVLEGESTSGGNLTRSFVDINIQ